MLRAEMLNEILESFWGLKLHLNSSIKTVYDFKKSDLTNASDYKRLDEYLIKLRIIQKLSLELISEWNIEYDDEVFMIYIK